MSKLQELLKETRYKTSETARRMATRYQESELLDMLEQQNQERERLIRKYGRIDISDVELMKFEIGNYMGTIIEQINFDYGHLIPEDKLAKLNNMLYNDCVIVIDDPKDRHDFSADTRIGKVIVNLARIAKTDEEPEPDIYRKIAVANGCLPHEIFHMIITMLKQEELADERMIINLKNGLQITARGMVGFMLNEGFVEKFSSEFAERNGLYHQIAPQYLPYVDICNFIMEQHEDVNENTIFSLEAHEIILRLTPEEQQEYYDAETISYAVRHRDLNADDIANTKIQIEELPYKISPERKKELMNYMLLKEQKFEETVALPTSRRRLF